LWLLFAAYSQAASPEQIMGSNVMARVVARSAEIAKAGATEKYSYEKRSVLEELDSRGQAIRSTEKLYQVELVGGWPFSRLVKVQGRELSPEQLRAEEERERAFRNKLAGRDLGKAPGKREAWVRPEIVSRYEFTYLSNDVRQVRETVVLQFKRKATNPETTAQDRIYNRLQGRVWVDAAEAEIVRLQVELTEELSLGFLGFLGSLSQCDLNLERNRMADGVWVNAKHTLLIVGRKLLSPMRFRTTEESSGFRPG
jgi:hypothetical protein